MTAQRGRYTSLAGIALVLMLVLVLGVCSQAPKAQQTSGPSPTQTATSAPATPSTTPPATSTAAAAATVAATPEPSAATEAPAATAAPAAAPATTQAPPRTQAAAATQAAVATQAPPPVAPAPAPTPARTAVPTAEPPPPTAPPTVPPTQAPAPTTAPLPPPTAQPTGGFVFPTFFVTILESRNGRLGVLTSGGATCSAVARLPDNATILQLGSRTVPSSGMVNFDYAPTTQSGVGVHRVDCSFNGQSQFAEARFNAP